LKEVVLNEGLTAIGSNAFQYCSSLQSITLPSTVKEIGEYTFNSCNSLKEVVLNEGLEKIGGHVFAGCTSLQNITIPTTVDDIGSSAFFSCTNLRDVVFKEGTKRIKTGAFEWCTSLERITIPSTVVEIGKFAFNTCRRLREVVLHNEEVQIGDKAFTNCRSLERFKFPRLSIQLDNIIQAGQRGIEAKIDDISEVEWRGGELVIPVARRYRGTPYDGLETLVMIDKEKLNKVVGLVRYYEVKEATTLFELALWKCKIDQTDISNPSDRGIYRTEVPGPVKDTILQYLRSSDDCEDSSSSSSSEDEDDSSEDDNSSGSGS